ncbi:MAG: hypothetical protein ACOCYG_07150 [Spirochaetota bacterium]
MKSLMLALLIGAVASTSSLSQTAPQCKEIGADITALQEFYPRLEGSVTESEAQSYILDRLREIGLEPRRLPIGPEVEGHSFSASISAAISGSSDDTLLLVAPLNHGDEAGPGADGSAAIAGLLQLARIYSGTTPPVTLRLVFVGADHDDRSLGSRSLIEDLTAQHNTAVVYLAQQAADPVVSLRTAARDEVAPRWLVQGLSETLRTNEVPYSLSLTRAQAARAGRAEEETPIAEYMAAGIPAVAVTDDPGSAATPGGMDGSARGDAAGAADMACRISSAVADFIEQYQGGFPSTWDRHYIFYSGSGSTLFLGETAYVLILIAVIVGALLYGLLFRGRLSRYVETLRRNFLNMPVIFLVVFGALALSGALLNRVIAFRDFPNLWEHYPSIFFISKMLLSAGIYLVLHRLFLSATLSKNGSYYSASALAALFVGIIVLAVIDVSVTPYFLWAFVFAFFFSVVRNRILKVSAFLLSTAWLVQLTVEVFRAPLLSIADNLVSSSSVANLLIAVVLLPFVLMLIRIDFLFRKGPITGRGFVGVAMLVIMGVGGLGGVAYLTFAWPYSAANPQPVRMTETIDHTDETHRVVFESEASLGTFDVTFGEELLAVRTDARRFAVRIEGRPDLVQLTQTQTQFLNRSRRRLFVEPAFPLAQVEVTLEAEEDIVILDANFPVAESESPNSVGFQIGPSPPLPLEVDYTVPVELDAMIHFRGTARRLSRDVAVETEAIDIIPLLTITQTLDES